MSTKQDNGGHWYSRTGEPMHWVKRASGEGTRPTTLADARKLDLLPSVTTILRTLDKPPLNRWKTCRRCRPSLLPRRSRRGARREG